MHSKHILSLRALKDWAEPHKLPLNVQTASKTLNIKSKKRWHVHKTKANLSTFILRKCTFEQVGQCVYFCLNMFHLTSFWKTGTTLSFCLLCGCISFQWPRNTCFHWAPCHGTIPVYTSPFQAGHAAFTKIIIFNAQPTFTRNQESQPRSFQINHMQMCVSCPPVWKVKEQTKLFHWINCLLCSKSAFPIPFQLM